MKGWHKATIGLLTLVVLFVVCGFALPSQVRVERSRLIEAAPATIMEHVSDFRRWPAWSPWVEPDPEITWRYEGPQQGVGAIQSWTGPKSGRRKIRLTEVAPDRISYEIWLDGNTASNPAGFLFSPNGEGTDVRWFHTAELGNNPFARWYGVFMDRIDGPEYARGLERLASVTESVPD